MQTTIQTPAGSKLLHVCKDSNGGNPEWVHVYEASFPHNQRQNLAEIQGLMQSGTMELDETRDQDEHVLCLTLTEVFDSHAPEFLLACYTATLPAMRSCGIGSIHRRRLVELLQQEYPHHLGLFSEIESTKEPGLAPHVLELRQRRLAFFLRLGVERLAFDYRFPSYQPGEPALQGELLWVPFGNSVLDSQTLAEVLKRIYVEGYGLSPDDPFVVNEMAKARETPPSRSGL